MDRDFQLGGKNFKLNKIDAINQFHVVRRIGPILSDLLPALKDAQKINSLDKVTQEDQLENLAKVLAPVMTGFSKLSDEDAEFVLHSLLKLVEMQQPAGNWAKISTGKLLMFQDLELPFLINLASRAFAFNMSGFFAALPQ